MNLSKNLSTDLSFFREIQAWSLVYEKECISVSPQGILFHILLNNLYTLVLLLSIGIQILEIPIYQKNSHVLGPGQIVTSLEHLAQCRGVEVTSLCHGVYP